jgi:hypothetical protein
MATKGKYTGTSVPIKIVHSNLDQEVIQVTEDKIRLVLNEHLRNIECRKDWIAPLSLLIAIVTTFITSSFKDALLSASTWEAIYILSGALSVAWLVKALWALLTASTLDDVVAQIKNTRD